jgi:sugar phosphate isomerase/epimerase
MKNKIGVVTSTYPKFSLLEALGGISNAGFKYVELASSPGFFEHIQPRPENAKKEDVGRLLKTCESFGLKLYCIAGHTRLMKENAINNFKKVIDYAEIAGIKYITTDTGEVKSEKDKQRFFDDMTLLGCYAETKGITICLETHGVWLNNGKTGSEIIKKLNLKNVKLNYDTGNVMYYGAVRAEDDIKNALPYMGFMHLKERTDNPKEWDFPALGDGKLDFTRIFKLIRDYSGPISVEVEFDEKGRDLQQTDAAVKKSYEFLRNSGIL